MEEITDEIEEGEMPLDSYTWMHREAKLTDVEKKDIIDWANRVRADMEAKYKPRDEEIKKLQAEITEIEKNLQSGKLTPVAAQDAQATGQRKQRELQRKTQDLQEEVQRERDEILSRSSQQMQEIVQKLAEEKGIDVVIVISNTVYFKPALEITTESIAAYDKAYPPK